MRILHVTPEAPGYTSGGTICVRQSLLMLDPENNEIDYAGPQIQNNDIRILYNKTYELEPSTSLLDLVRTILHLQQNKRYLSWKRLNLDLSIYDYVYMDFTKLDYVAKDVVKKAIPLVVRAHNVECDYAKNDYIASKNIIKWFTLLVAKSHEKYIVSHATKLVTLTQNDLNRFKDIYGLDDNKTCIIPICLDNPSANGNTETHDTTRLLVTGSLWYGVNLDGILWMINEALPKTKSNFVLRIAGGHPSEEFKQLCKEKAIELIDTPPSMREHLEWCDAVVVPIFSGAGMKVKIAEALSYGKPLITTSFGAIGYDVKDSCNSYIADNPNEFAEAIDSYCELPTKDRKQMSKNALNLFEQKYNIEIGKKMLQEELLSL